MTPEPVRVEMRPQDEFLAIALGNYRNLNGRPGQALSYTTTGSDFKRNIAACRAEVAGMRYFPESVLRVSVDDGGWDLDWQGLKIDIKFNTYSPDRASLYFNGRDRDHAMSNFKADVAVLVLPEDEDLMIYGYVTKDQFGTEAAPPPWAGVLDPAQRPAHRRKETPWAIPARDLNDMRELEMITV